MRLSSWTRAAPAVLIIVYLVWAWSTVWTAPMHVLLEVLEELSDVFRVNVMRLVVTALLWTEAAVRWWRCLTLDGLHGFLNGLKLLLVLFFLARILVWMVE